MLLGSIGRNLAYDLVARTAVRTLPSENQTALTLATFWLGHHLLDLEPLATTRWLDQAVERDGRAAVAAYIRLLAAGVPVPASLCGRL